MRGSSKGERVRDKPHKSLETYRTDKVSRDAVAEICQNMHSKVKIYCDTL